jgi:amino acid adenylation domain-containing protein
MTCIDELFELQAERTPDAIAVVFKETSLTYGELNQRANDLAYHLRALGVGPDVLVALYLERSLEMVVGMLGVLKAKGAYVPLDLIHPPQRLAYMVADAQPLVLLTHERLRLKLPPHSAQVVAIDNVRPAPRALRPALRYAPRNPRDLAYVIYTSGSTGNPKGVEIEHRSVVNMLGSMQKTPGLSPGDTMLAVTTLVFDIAVLEILLPLTIGARIVMVPSEITRDGVALSDLIECSSVTVIQATPSTFQMLLDVGWTGSAQLKILCGGEAWTEELASQLLPCCGSLWNMYGPTETTVWSAVSKVEPGRAVVVGAPIDRTNLYVLDNDLQPVPIGAPGELYIAGEGLARGYFHRPELTQERFVPDPFSQVPGARMYRTGDQMLRGACGTLKFLGRLDHQVNIRGFRIELGEIESKLRSYPGVARAVVVVREDPHREKRLVAYFVGEADFSPTALRAHLAAALPDYMVPAAYMRLEALPLTPNGKLDRAALPPPVEPENESERAVAEPRTPTEQIMARVWCEILNLKKVGVRDNFFDLGGHSLLAVRVIGTINKTLQGVLTIPVFYQEPTIERLAQAFEKNRGAERGAQLLPLQTGDIGLPLYFIGAGPHEVRLAQHIGEDRPIFAIESPIPTQWHSKSAAADRPAVPKIEELGALYGDGLYAHAGASPCVIAGYSFAGKMAFEAARVLQRAGGNVAFVLLIDTPVYGGEGHTGVILQRSIRWISQTALIRRKRGVHYLRMIGSALRDCVRLMIWLSGRLPRVVKNHMEKLRNGFSTAAVPSGYFDKNGIPIDETVMSELNYRSTIAWKPRQLDTAGILFRVKFPGETMLPGYDRAKGWGELFTRGLRVVHAAGDHMTMVRDENILALTRQIRDALDQNEIVQNQPVKRHDDEADIGFSPSRRKDAYQLQGLS